MVSKWTGLYTKVRRSWEQESRLLTSLPGRAFSTSAPKARNGSGDGARPQLGGESKKKKSPLLSPKEELPNPSPLHGSRDPPTPRPCGRRRRVHRRGAHPGPVLHTSDLSSATESRRGARFLGRGRPREAAEGPIPPRREGDDPVPPRRLPAHPRGARAPCRRRPGGPARARRLVPPHRPRAPCRRGGFRDTNAGRRDAAHRTPRGRRPSTRHRRRPGGRTGPGRAVVARGGSPPHPESVFRPRDPRQGRRRHRRHLPPPPGPRPPADRALAAGPRGDRSTREGRQQLEPARQARPLRHSAAPRAPRHRAARPGRGPQSPQGPPGRAPRMTTFKGGRKSRTGARTGLGRSFAGLIRYLQQGHRDRPDPARVAWSSTRNLDTDNPAEAAQLMRYAASENPRVEEPVYHFGLSLAEGEHLTREQWEDAAGRVLASMGLADHQAVLLAHRDTDHEHVHIVVNRIGDDGRAWRPFRDMVHAHEAIPGIEIEYGLSRTGRDQAPPDLNAGAVRETMRTGVQPLADRVREQAGHVFAQATSWVELEAGLAELGFRLEPAERGSGLVVTDGSRRVSLSKVDRNLSGPKLAARFGETFREHRERHPEPPQVQRQAGDRELPPLGGATTAERAAALVDRMTATRATFTKADVQRAAFHERDSRAIARLALDRDETVIVGTDARGVTRYASTDYLRDEARLFHAAGELAARHQLRLDPGNVQRALDRAPQLSEEQRGAVLAATTRDDLALIVGRAGAGQTTAAATIAEAYRDAGYDVVGAALAGKAADTLQQEAGIHSRTLHSWEYSWGRGEETLDRRIVLVIDEAGMVDARQLSRVLDHAAAHDAKVILLGDPDQLKPIGPGDAYRGLLEQHAPARLETIRRQAEPWQREASEHLAGGRVAPALDAYQQAGRLHVADTRDAARAELLEQYAADRAADPAPPPPGASSCSPPAPTRPPASIPASAISAWPPASSAATSPSPAPTTPPATVSSSSRTTTRAAREPTSAAPRARPPASRTAPSRLSSASRPTVSSPASTTAAGWPSIPGSTATSPTATRSPSTRARARRS